MYTPTGYQDYEVSQDGLSVRRPYHTTKRRSYGDGFKYLCPFARGDGRVYFRLGRSLRAADLLVAQSWSLPGWFEGAVLAHKNGDTSDCRLSNLEWVAPAERHLRARIEHDLSYPGQKLTAREAYCIKLLYGSGYGTKTLALKFGVSPSTINSIGEGRRWSQALRLLYPEVPSLEEAISLFSTRNA